MDLFYIQSDDRCNKSLQTCFCVCTRVCTLIWQMNLMAVSKWVPYRILYIKNNPPPKKSSQQKIPWYESLEMKPTSMKCTALKKTQLKSVYTNMLYESDAGGGRSCVTSLRTANKIQHFLKYSSTFDPFHSNRRVILYKYRVCCISSID